MRARASVRVRVWLLRAQDESTLRAHVWLPNLRHDRRSKEKVHPGQTLTRVQHCWPIQTNNRRQYITFAFLVFIGLHVLQFLRNSGAGTYEIVCH